MNTPAPAPQNRRALVSLTVEKADEEAVRQGAKGSAQLLDLVHTHNFDEAFDALNKRKPIALVCDWNSGSIEEISVFLQKVRATPPCAAMAIIVIAPEPLEEQTAAVCAEYSVRNILFSSTLATSLGAILSDILGEASKPSAMRSFLARIDAAHAKGEVGDLDMAALDFYTLFPNEPRAKIEYANFCLRRGEWKKAEEIISKVVTKDPSNLRAVNVMVRVLLHDKKFADAQQLLGEAELMSPNNVGRIVLLGDLYREKGMKTEAEAKYRSALQILPQNREAKQGVAKINLSVGELNSALQLLRESSTQEEIASFFNDAAILAVQQKKFGEAYKLYQASLSALEKKNLRSRVLYNVGLAFRKDQKPDRAVEFFKRSVAEDPSFVRAQDTLLALGIPVESVSALETLATHAPASPAAAGRAAPAAAVSPDNEFMSVEEPAGENAKKEKEESGFKQVSDEKKVERWGDWEVVVSEEGEMQQKDANPGQAPKNASPQGERVATNPSQASPQAPQAPGFIDEHDDDS